MSSNNEDTTLPLHVAPGLNWCSTAGDPCQPGAINVELSPGEINTVFLYVRHYEEIAAVQTAFDWPSQWTYLGGDTDCLPSQTTPSRPPGGPGPTQGTLIADFDCITGGATRAVALLWFIPAIPGCLVQIESAFPDGTAVLGCDFVPVAVPAAQRGSVCVGPGGVDVCGGPVAVEAATWGAMKRQYR